MNREILFRGKRKDNGEWVFGFYYESERYRKKVHRIYNWITHLHYDVIPETVGQYTELSAYNGDKIFDGDIINIFERKIENAVVYWDDLFVGWHAKNKKEPLITLFKTTHENYEVIGNIHDNPELLE